MKSFRLFASGTLSIAIALSVAPVNAQEQLSVASNTHFGSNPPFDLDASTQHSTFTNSTGFVLNQAWQQLPSQSWLTDSKELVHPRQTLKHASGLGGESSIEPRAIGSIESIFPLNPIAQADVTPPPPSEPDSEPASSDPLIETASDRWQLSVAPYFFVPFRVRTDVTVAGRSASINLGLGSILNFDRAFDAGLRVEGWKDRWGVIFDGFYISAKNSGNIGVTFPQGSLQQFGINFPVRLSTDASLSVRQGTVDLAASYRLVDTRLSSSEASPNPFPRLIIAPIVGLRTNLLSQKLEVDTIRIGAPLGTITLPVNQDFSFFRTFVEPMIGAQIGLDLSERWAIGVRGDVSGFNISADRNLTWNLIASTQYQLSPSTSLQLGYRFNNFDFEDGSGLRRARINLRQNGLLLSVIFRF